MPPRPRRSELDERVERSAFLVDLFDHVPDVVVFVKDAAGRYVAVNDTLVRRLGLRDEAAVLGRTAVDLFPPPLGARYLAQDLEVVRGEPITDLLELHLFADGAQGWCLTSKVPIRGDAGTVIGLAGTSRDVSLPDPAVAHDLAAALRTIHEEFARPLRVEELAAQTSLSPYQFSRRIQALFGLTPAKLLTKTRIDAACRMLVADGSPISGIAQACGYTDQSAFTRQFKAMVGLTPARYRERRRGSPS